MHRRVISLRALTEVSEVNDTQVFTVNKKLVSMRPSYMIKDVEGRLLGEYKSEDSDSIPSKTLAGRQ
jgi:hypothetical protein